MAGPSCWSPGAAESGSAYTLSHLIGDVVASVAALGEQRAVVAFANSTTVGAGVVTCIRCRT